MDHAMRIVDRVVEALIRSFSIDEMQCDFMLWRCTNDVIFFIRQFQEKYMVANKPLHPYTTT